MKHKEIVKKIVELAKRDEEYRRDPRYLNSMGLLLAKGFLKTNLPIPLRPNQRLHLEDVIWAGRNIEPRILEVLPAAIVRMPQHFDLDAEKHVRLFQVVTSLKKQEPQGEPLWGIPYDKIKQWMDLPISDRRVKDLNEKRIAKNFRLKPKTIAALRKQSKKLGCSETEVLERAVYEFVAREK